MRGDAFVALGISRRPIVEPHPRVVQRDKILAIARQMLVAARAGTAARKADDDRVAHAQPFDAFADRLDRPGAFMAEASRQRERCALVAADETGMTKAAPSNHHTPTRTPPGRDS